MQKVGKVKQALVGIAIGITNGFFGAGGGMLAVPVLKRMYKLEDHKAHASALSVMLPLSAVSAAVYAFSNLPELGILLWAGGGSIVGAVVGGLMLGKIPNVWLSRVFAALMIVAAVRMVIF
ncbi:sulfite exporter TauE/SafE family protein [Gehongia tenuis]|uniref:Probable membrane transporter protein n=1 Tax=Gehongia tenuis TaxID=2763655 RepID=A0A926HPP6_9FIRM|nr:sulfite exporter TauE/SafE family protein [Gehongia tenuis]MBC8530406.1 sulfite exporter TauE/SafE family protein [Gehongia tenuis]